MTNITVDPQSPSVVSAESTSNPKTSRNISKPIFIGILVLVLLFVTAYGTYWYGQSVMVTKTTSSISSSVPTEKVSPPQKVSSASPSSAPVDETANWKTYANSKLGIEFKYPSSWYYLGAANNTDFPVVLSPVEIKAFPPDGLAGPVYFSIDRCTNTVTNENSPCNKTYEAFLENIKDQFTSDTVKVNSTFVLSGRKASQISGILKPSPAGENMYSKVTATPFGNYNFSVSLYRYDEAFEHIFDKILSTFKFLP